MDGFAQIGVGEEEVYEVLANRERRRIISILQNANEPLALAEIATELAEREGLEGEERWERADRLRIELYHCHLPKLDKADVVEYDEDRAVAWDSPFEPESAQSTGAPSP